MAKTNKNTQKRFGLFYRGNSQWTKTPYKGKTWTVYQLQRNPVRSEVAALKNYVLKSRVRIREVAA